MAFPSSASAGPNAAPVVVPASTELVVDSKGGEYFPVVAAPPPLHQRKTEYPAALPMRTDAMPPPPPPPSSAIILELKVQYDHPTIAKDPSTTAADGSQGLCTICKPSSPSENNNDFIFYRPQMALHKVLQQAEDSGQDVTPPATNQARVAVPNHLLPFVTLYGGQKQALWSLTNKDWHTMEFASPKQDHIVTLTTSTSLFSFTWLNGKTYQWRLVPASSPKTQQQNHPYDLRCYHDDKLVAEFLENRFVQWTTATEQPFNALYDIQFSSFLLLSGLLIHEHLSSILRSLGGGPEAVQLVTDPSFAATATGADDDDDASLGSSSFYGEREPYYADQGLVDGQHAATGRWYSTHSGTIGGGAGSVKSIELDPGLLRCFWGYGFWWTWCPCCMPGGWFDRLWINCRLQRRKMTNNTAPMSRSRQRRQRGWQQHHPEQY
ncbi:hypothetical protein BJV82DRAFT_615209 [Fennellomyces sp. T-0311]|nr:hypothetical protein BJV82DRAFT_615209 [Fennellomyces sp. T-0311]